MEWIQKDSCLDAYLQSSRSIDFTDPLIQAQAESIFRDCGGELEKINAAFLFVRDEIPHSGDLRSRRVTRTASEALRYREGICYAKSALLAALLRSTGIPAGICYQRLTRGDTPETGYCIHALNAVYLSGWDRWVRLDARGNTGVKNAQFYMDDPLREQVAFPVRPAYDEKDYTEIYAEPLPAVMQTLERYEDCREMLAHGLPQSLDGKPPVILETDRLLLREMQEEDLPDLREILQNKEVMTAYEHAFSEQEVRDWLENQQRRYREDGFGLWAVVLKQTKEVIGQTGLTMQDAGGKQVVEVGYLFKKSFWHKGYATEAAIACKRYAFETLHAEEVYSIIRDNNFASQAVARRNGMRPVGRIVKQYYQMELPHLLFRAERQSF
ncbi:GNAT family N-acetyltransferase [Clostridium sp. D33t1_170424_F3]|uniref:GNAT family N-acetyltransferase n=1 Tax=Clostridium sp. D33t1_170424_F3 TaxID=2787099 RepID=UPI002570FF52|nr:GNAT family N-acetyltransferase [Clostridium sp. D33t1_170424_F3]